MSSQEQFAFPDDPIHLIEPQSITLTGKLKEGSFSVIHTGIYEEGKRKEKKYVAAKEFKGNHEEEKEGHYFRDIRELQLSVKKNKNLVQIIGTWQTQKHLCVVMNLEAPLRIDGEIISNLFEYLMYLRRKCELRNIQILENKKKEDLIDLSIISPFEELHSMAIQIAEGCEYLSRQKIIHGDLAARNVLIDAYKEIKLIDYGFVNTKNHLLNYAELCRFPYYRWSSPEVTALKQYSLKSDVWSFGILLWEIGTLGAFPYGDLTNGNFIELRQEEWKAKKKHAREPHKSQDFFVEFFTDNSKNLMKDCWRVKPEKRPDFSEIIKRIGFARCPKKEKCSFYKSLDSFWPTSKKRPKFLETKADLDAQKAVDIDVFPKKFIRDKTEDLGRGTFGAVIKYKIVNDVLWGNKDVAIKILDSLPVTSEGCDNQRRMFVTETKAFGKLGKHENLVEIIGICLKPMSVMMEYHSLQLDGKIILSSLQKYLQYLRERLQKENVVSDHNHKELGWFAIQIARGMRHLEENKIVHSNLAARNVLINNAKILKIADFGYQGQGLYQVTKSRKLNLSNSWAAPEVILKNSYTTKSDVWAFAVVLWEIGTLGEHPDIRFRQEELEKLISKKSSVGLLARKGSISIELWELMLPCWTGSSTLRPDFEQLLLELEFLKTRQNIYLQLLRTSVCPPIKEEKIQNYDQQEKFELSLEFPSTPPPLSPSPSPPPPPPPPPLISPSPPPFPSPSFSPPLHPPPYSPSARPLEIPEFKTESLHLPDYPSTYPPGPSGASGQYFPQNIQSDGSQNSINFSDENNETKPDLTTSEKYGTFPRSFNPGFPKYPGTKYPPTKSSAFPHFTPHRAVNQTCRTPVLAQTLPRSFSQRYDFIIGTPPRPAFDGHVQKTINSPCPPATPAFSRFVSEFYKPRFLLPMVQPFATSGMQVRCTTPAQHGNGNNGNKSKKRSNKKNKSNNNSNSNNNNNNDDNTKSPGKK